MGYAGQAGVTGLLDGNGQFQRFSSDDPVALAARTAGDLDAFAREAAGMPALRRLELLSRAGSSLTVLRREGDRQLPWIGRGVVSPATAAWLDHLWLFHRGFFEPQAGAGDL